MRTNLMARIFWIMMALSLVISVTAQQNDMLIIVHQCDNCHNMHDPQGATLLAEINAENTCLTCHSPAGASSLKAAVHENTTYGGYRHTCLDCHDPHDNQQNSIGSFNIKLVLASVDTPNSGSGWDVIFVSRGTTVGDPALHSFADGDSNRDGICEVCHTLTRFHRNNSTAGMHAAGQTCTRCHFHINGFLGN